MANWKKIEHDYAIGIEKDGILTYPNLKELSKIYGVKYQTLRAKAVKEKWKARNLQKSTKILQKIDEKIIKDVSERAVETKVLFYNALESLIKVTNKIIPRLEDEKEEDPDARKPTTKPMDIKLLMSSTIEGMKAVEGIISEKADSKLSDLADAIEAFKE